VADWQAVVQRMQQAAMAAAQAEHAQGGGGQPKGPGTGHPH
jgi:hypothetical protein